MGSAPRLTIVVRDRLLIAEIFNYDPKQFLRV
jgi:hypothetical protein